MLASDIKHQTANNIIIDNRLFRHTHSPSLFNWNAGYEQLLELFSLSDLQQRRLYLDLCSMYRIVHGMFYFPSAVFVRQDTHRFTRSSYHPSFVCPYARTCYYFNSFVPRTVRLWNTLPTPITNNPSIVNNPTTSMYSFKSSLRAHMFH